MAGLSRCGGVCYQQARISAAGDFDLLPACRRLYVEVVHKEPTAHSRGRIKPYKVRWHAVGELHGAVCAAREVDALDSYFVVSAGHINNRRVRLGCRPFV